MITQHLFFLQSVYIILFPLIWSQKIKSQVCTFQCLSHQVLTWATQYNLTEGSPTEEDWNTTLLSVNYIWVYHRAQDHYHGTSLAVQWLRLYAPNAGGTGLIPGWAKIMYVIQGGQKKKSLSLLYIKNTSPNIKIYGHCEVLPVVKVKVKSLSCLTLWPHGL